MRKRKNGKVYLLTCETTGLKYIGRTWQEVSTRLQKHFSSAKKLSQYNLYADMLKYGKPDFTFKVLHEGITNRAELNRLEQQEILLHGTLEPDGYNQPANKRRVYTRGTEHHRYGKSHLPSTCQKIAEANRGQKRSPEQIERIRQAALERERRKRLERQAATIQPEHENDNIRDAHSDKSDSELPF